jgi:hypothetical protein
MVSGIGFLSLRLSDRLLVILPLRTAFFRQLQTYRILNSVSIGNNLHNTI